MTPTQVYRRLLAEAAHSPGRLVAIAGALALASAAALAAPWPARNLLRSALVEGRREDLLLPLAMVLAALILHAVLRRFAEVKLSLVSLEMIERLRVRMTDKLLRRPMADWIAAGPGDALSRLFNDLNLVRVFLHSAVFTLASDVLVMIGAAAFLFHLNPRLMLVLVGAGPLALLTIGLAGRRVRRGYTQAQERIAALTSVLAEQAGGIAVIRAFASEERELQRVAEGSAAVTRAVQRGDRRQATARAIVQILSAAGAVLVVAWMTYDSGGVAMSADDLVGFALYAILLAEPITRISRTHLEMQQSLVAGRRIFELLDEGGSQEQIGMSVPPKYEPTGMAVPAVSVPAVSVPPVSVPPVSVEPTILAFQGIRFAHRPGDPVLRDLDLTLHPGVPTALVGESGSGKSTLAALALRFFEPDSGSITLGGADIRTLASAALRRTVGWVGQDPFLFSLTVRDNIAYGRPDASIEAVRDAARIAGADEFVLTLPSGYFTKLGDRGGDVSGGQRMRLALARTILADPAVALLDECTASLDPAGEAALWRELMPWLAHRTSLVIAHRPATVLAFPRIVVLDGGRIVGDGAAADLRKGCPAFRSLFGA